MISGAMTVTALRALLKTFGEQAGLSRLKKAELIRNILDKQGNPLPESVL